MTLLRLLPRDLRDSITGDLNEEFLRVRRRQGRWRAAAWGWANALRVVVAFAQERYWHGRGVPPLGEELRQARSGWDSFAQDVRFGIRLLRHQPAFTAVALVALAIGIGANTAIFSVVDAVLWRALPYPDADRVMQVAEQRPREGRTYGAVSPADFFDWRRETRSFDALAAYGEAALNLTGVGEPERIRALTVTSGFLEALGVVPAAGRGFTIQEETVGRHRVAVLTDGLWRRRFGTDPTIVGRSITVDGAAHVVVGVLPRTFWWPAPADVLVPLALTDGDRALRSAHFLELIGRLRSGVPERQAREELSVIGGRLEQAYPEDNNGHGPSLRPLHEALVGDVRVALLALFGACGFVLLIACANVATLLLARATRRQKELAIRRAVGATRARVVRQMMIESLIVSGLGSAVGLLLAAWLVAVFRSVLSTQFSELPGLDRIGLDARVLVAAVVASGATGIAFGALPALVASGARVNVGLTDEARGSSGSVAAGRLRSALIVAELAVSLILLAGAALLIVSFSRLTRVSPGFQSDHLVTASINLPVARYGGHHRAVRFYEAVIDRLRGESGIERVAVTSASPFTGLDARLDLNIEQPTIELKPPVRAHPRLVSPEYFATMGVPIVRGRPFDEHDADAARRVAIINQTAAQRFWPNANPIGRRISLGRPAQWMEIVGIVGDVRHEALAIDVEPEAYIPFRQGFTALGVGLDRAMTLMVRANADTGAVGSLIRTAVHGVDPQQPIGRIRAMDQLIAESVGPQRLNYLLISAFAVVAVVLSAAGLDGVITYLVAQRTREIGVRMALGASSRQVVAMVLRQAGVLTTVGIACGVAGSLVIMRSVASLLFGVSAANPMVYIAASALLAAVALAAAAVPSRRAARIDPLIALRDA